MLNAEGNRELAYVVTIDDIKPIEGRDRVECAVVGGWTVMVRKNQFKPGDLGIYFEIDSKVPAKEPFMFLEGKHFKIKTQKYKTPNGQFWSQGLLMGAEDFGWETIKSEDGSILSINGYHEGDFLTKILGVIYADPEDNSRKSKSSVDKYQKMAQRMGKKFAKQPYRWLMKRTWGKKLLFFFYGKKKDTKAWPEWVKKTDEERIQNLVYMIPTFQNEKWIPTEKIDGTSTTFTMKRGKRGKNDFFICSRNVVFDKPDKKCFYETNVYTEMAEKYDIENVLKSILDENKDLLFVTIQGETYGEGVQKRDYSIKGHDFMAFNLIFGDANGVPTRKNPMDMSSILSSYKIPCVPFFEPIELPDTCDEILALAGGESAVDGLPREGLVFRTLDGCRSFKAVDNGFLLKYHG